MITQMRWTRNKDHKNQHAGKWVLQAKHAKTSIEFDVSPHESDWQDIPNEEATTNCPCETSWHQWNPKWTACPFCRTPRPHVT